MAEGEPRLVLELSHDEARQLRQWCADALSVPGAPAVAFAVAEALSTILEGEPIRASLGHGGIGHMPRCAGPHEVGTECWRLVPMG